ncbi:hypothetical protein D3C74_467610 [compost metagenome]
MPPTALAIGPCRAGTEPYMHIQVITMPAAKAMNADQLTDFRREDFGSRNR